MPRERNNEGPVVTIIPAREKTSCWQCKYFDRSMMKSGHRPEYMSRCMHKDVGNEPHNFHLGIIDRYSGKSDTPRWCPFLEKQKGPI